MSDQPIRQPLGRPVGTTYPLRGGQLACPFGCGDTLAYTDLGVQCSTSTCASLGGPVSRIPDRSPYSHGDRVQLHGYEGNPPGHGHTGFRGTVTGSLGSTILRGLTDRGEEWAESWGALVPDGTPSEGWVFCSCCPRPPRAPVRLALFADVPS